MFRLLARRRTRLFNMFWNRINQVNLVAESSEPAGVNTGTSSGIDDDGGRRGQMAKNQFSRALLLELKPA